MLGLVHMRYFADFDAMPEFLEERSCVHPEVSAMIISHPVTEIEQVLVRHLLRPDFLCLLQFAPEFGVAPDDIGFAGLRDWHRAASNFRESLGFILNFVVFHH